MKTLKKLGFSFDEKKLTDIDVSIFNVIDDELAKIEREEMKKPRKK